MGGHITGGECDCPAEQVECDWDTCPRAAHNAETSADVFFDTPRGPVRVAFGPVWAWLTWPDGTREKMKADDARDLACQMAEPN